MSLLTAISVIEAVEALLEENALVCFAAPKLLHCRDWDFLVYPVEKIWECMKKFDSDPIKQKVILEANAECFASLVIENRNICWGKIVGVSNTKKKR